ncbi:MAG: hypothetical protein R3D28_07505 [Geminicoccaceae bacterium]
MIAARPLVGAGQPDVGDPAEIGVIDGAQHPRRDAHDHRPLRQVNALHDIDSGGVGGQEQRAGIEQILADADAAVEGNAGLLEAPAQGVHRGGRHAREEGLHATPEIELVECHLRRGGVGHAVLEMQGADPGLDRVGRRDLRRHVGRVCRLRAGPAGQERHCRRKGAGHQELSRHGHSGSPLAVRCFTGQPAPLPQGTGSISPGLQLWSNQGSSAP